MYEARERRASDQGSSSQLKQQPSAMNHSSSGTPDEFRTTSSFRSLSINHEPQSSIMCSAPPGDAFNIPESRSRRLLELRLLHHFLTTTIYTFPGANSDLVNHCWSIEIPKMALHYEPLLHEILSLSALHLLKSGSNELELQAARRDYLHLALREHRHSVPRLSTETADAVGFTCVVIVVDAFVQLQDRTIEPYTPPIQWLQLARGAHLVLTIASEWVKDNPEAITTKIGKDDPVSGKYAEIFGEENRRGFSDLLNQDLPPGRGPQEPWDTETRQAYELTLSYIGEAQKAVRAGEHYFGISRRLTTFAVLVPKRFVELTEQREPRTLVVLAHYFALGAGIDLWWIGDTVRREICAIQKELPDEWQPFLREPLAAIGIK
jgi:Fungal specific transcription factor domain